MSGVGLSPLRGVLQLARGRPEGLAQFGGTVPAFLSSLAPLIAFSIVGGLLTLGVAEPMVAFSIFLLSAITQLAPPVLSHLIAVRWGREEDWLRYATAFNWCQCLTPLGVLATAVAMSLGIGLGLSPRAAQSYSFLVLLGYVVWLQWLVARHGLDLSRGRAAGLVALVTVGTCALIILPELLAQAL